MQEQQNPFKTTWPTWATVARFVSFTESFVSDNQWNSAREDQQPDRPNTLHSQPNHSLHGSFMLKGGWARSIVQMTLLYRNKVQIGSQRKPLLENLLAKGTSQLPLIIFFFFTELQRSNACCSPFWWVLSGVSKPFAEIAEKSMLTYRREQRGTETFPSIATVTTGGGGAGQKKGQIDECRLYISVSTVIMPNVHKRFRCIWLTVYAK